MALLSSSDIQYYSPQKKSLLQRSVAYQLEHRSYIYFDEPIQYAKDQLKYAANYVDLNNDQSLIELSNTFLAQPSTPVMANWIWYEENTKTAHVKMVDGGDNIRRVGLHATTEGVTNPEDFIPVNYDGQWVFDRRRFAWWKNDEGFDRVVHFIITQETSLHGKVALVRFFFMDFYGKSFYGNGMVGSFLVIIDNFQGVFLVIDWVSSQAQKCI